MSNLLTYTLQLGLLIGIAGWMPSALRLSAPKARLAFYQALLAASLLLPFMRPWKTETIAIERFTPATHVSAAAASPIPQRAPLDTGALILAVLAIGMALRLGILAVGMLRLRRYRLRSAPIQGLESWRAEADILLSREVGGPVTFGFFRPVILLPERFPDLPAESREAILCHETLHVRRCDWLFTLMEELVRAGLWFHPAIWWLLGEIQLAREQAVDQEAIDMTHAREPYVDALLAAAGAAIEPDLAPAPLFLRKRHLKQRVVSILKEKRMSKTRTVSTLAASLALLAGACWYLTGALPLFGSPQAAPDGAGVTIDLMGSQLMHRAPVRYPAEALQNKVEGVIVAQVTTDRNGDVTDAKILSGPDELRKAVLQSLLSWHFTRDAAGSMRQVAVAFRIPQAAPPTEGVTGGVPGGVTRGVVGGVPGGVAGGVEMPRQTTTVQVTGRPLLPNSGSAPAQQLVVRNITVEGVGVPADQILSKLPLHVEDAWTPESAREFLQALHAVDQHLTISMQPIPPSGISIQIRPMSTPPVVSGPITVGGRVQAAKLIRQVQPVYPADARAANVSGTVEMGAVIGPDGQVMELHVISGDPMLRQAALDAVKQWVYKPTLLNDQPISVSTTVDVIFSLANENQ